MVDFATRLTNDYDLDEVLHTLAQQALLAAGLAGAGLTVGPNPRAGDMSFVTATDEVTTRVEKKQDEFREGACFEAGKRGEAVLVSALEATDLWPRYTSVALDAGFRSVAGIPMAADGEMIGVLNAYRIASGPWSSEDVAALELLARMATTYLTNAARLTEAQKLAAQLQHALDSRVLIEQAKGALSVRLGVDPDTAFDMMRSYARSHRRMLRNVAQEVIGGQLNIGDQN